MIDLAYEKILLPMRSLREHGLSPAEATLSQVIKLLNMKQTQRSPKHIAILQLLTSNIKFFQQKVLEMGPMIHYECCSKITYEFFPSNSNVFEHGSYGKKFYIILDGTVAVMMQVKNEEINEMSYMQISELGNGDSFGELALLKDQPRIATIRCISNCHLAVLNKDDYMKIIGKVEARKLDALIEFLKGIPLFSCWPRKKIEKMTYFFTMLSYKRKQIVFEEGDSPKLVYIVNSGEFELKKFIDVKGGGNLRQRICVKVALLGPGEVFGEKEVALGKKYSYSCVCYSTFGELLVISNENFMMKFRDQKNNEDLIDKRKAKYKIREERLKNFQKIIQGSTIEANSSLIRGSGSIEIQECAVHRRSPNKNIKNYQKFSPLSKKDLEKIKYKALGIRHSKRKYIDIHAPIDLTTNESIFKTFSPRLETDTSFGEMVAHRPGGYYRANLKRPRSHIKRSSDPL